VGLGKRIAFSEEAVVFDQKTSQPHQLVNQRARWINTWFKYSKLGFNLIGLGVRRLSINQLLFGLVLLRPPLFIFLILSLIMMLVNLIVNPMISVAWLVAFASFIISFLTALTNSNVDNRIYKSLLGIPNFIFYQVISLTKAGKANQRSVSTKHNPN
jgi:cellulose synthase/poly-beta-1,6-N-acetylglucosamine synthase-like glycosyltransferase